MPAARELLKRVDGRRDILIYGAARIPPGLVLITTASIVSTSSGLTVLGQYALNWLIVLTVSAAASNWLRQSVLRFSDERPDGGLGALQASGFFLIQIVITLVLLMFVANSPWQDSLIFALCAPLASLSTLLITQLMVKQRSLLVLALETSRSVATILVLLFQPKPLSLFGVGIAFAIGYLPAIALRLTIECRRSRNPPNDASEALSLIQHLRYGWPLSVWLILGFLYTGSAKIFLPMIANYDISGIYVQYTDTAGKVTGLILSAVSTAVTPRAMNLANREMLSDGLEEAKKGLLLQGFAVVVLSLTSLFWGPLLGQVLFETQLSGALTALVILSVGMWELAALAQFPLLRAKRTIRLASYLLLITALQFAGVPIFFDHFGLLGVAACSVATAVLLVALLLVHWCRHNGDTNARRRPTKH